MGSRTTKGATMSTTKTAKGCECCGKARELNDDGYCALCEHRSLECDGYVQETLIGVLEVMVEKALEYVAPGDVFEAVHRALRQTGRDGAMPLAKTVELTHQARRRAERLEAVPA
jgi:hypothetical protein